MDSIAEDDPATPILLSLQRDGLHAALRMLNARTPHRFTGVYRYDSPMLRNVSLFDSYEPELRQGADAPLDESFCALVPSFGGSLAFEVAKQDARVAARGEVTPVISYCGVQLHANDGTVFGTLCHFDLKPCEARSSDVELLQLLAPHLATAATQVASK